MRPPSPPRAACEGSPLAVAWCRVMRRRYLELLPQQPAKTAGHLDGGTLAEQPLSLKALPACSRPVALVPFRQARRSLLSASDPAALQGSGTDTPALPWSALSLPQCVLSKARNR